MSRLPRESRVIHWRDEIRVREERRVRRMYAIAGWLAGAGMALTYVIAIRALGGW